MNRVIQRRHAALDQQHHRRRARNHLGQGCRVKNRVLGHRLDRWHQRAIAKCLVVTDAIAFEPKHAPRNHLVINGLTNGRIHFRQLGRLEGGQNPRRFHRRRRRRNMNRVIHHRRMTAADQPENERNGQEE